MLTATDLTVQYANAIKPALDRVSVTLARGELLAVAGPNGSGKTTLQRALLGLTPFQRGSVTLDQKPIGEWSRRAIAELIGALPQREDAAFPLSVAEAVLLGRWALLGPVSPVSDADHAAVAAALDRCDLAGFANRGIDTLSGGEWQRVRLARALAASPRTLILDEPTASLDIGHEMEIFELLHGLVNDGLSVMVITHQLNLAARYADRILLLDSGRVAALGTPREVLQPELLSQVFQWPLAVIAGNDGTPTLVPERKQFSPS